MRRSIVRSRSMPRHEIGQGVAFARAALAGNPSDGYGGSVLAMTFAEQSARAWARPARALGVQPPSDLVTAAARRFAQVLQPGALRTAIDWRTSIPRGVGLSGSSAIVIATLRALGDLYEVELTRSEVASFALAVEVEDLGIAAGLQDRVVQAYETLVYMDFQPRKMGTSRRGHYEALDPSLLPMLLIGWRSDAAADSSGVHAPLRARFERGEPAVLAGMAELAGLARTARAALLSGDRPGFAHCVDASLDARRAMMALDPRHVEMIERARACGASANYAGSGGAIVAVCRDRRQLAAVDQALAAIWCATVAPTPAAERSRAAPAPHRV